VVLLTVSVFATTEKDLFANFVNTHNKVYTDEKEFEARFLIFQDNMKRIMIHNAGNSYFKLGMNQFTDMSNEEYNEKMLSKYSVEQTDNVETLLEDLPPPASVDWRAASPPAVVPVRNQGACGSPLAISVVDSIAGEYAVLKKDYVYTFDIQMIVNCDGGACAGQTEDIVWNYIKKYGLLWYYDTTCPEGPGIGICVNGPNCTSYKNESDLQIDVAGRGPISVLIDASQPTFQLYTSGIYSDSKCSTNSPDHALQVVGYGSTNGQDYWIARNSWGTSWGMKGDILIARNKGNVCGIASHACYAGNVHNCVCIE